MKRPPRGTRWPLKASIWSFGLCLRLSDRIEHEAPTKLTEGDVVLLRVDLGAIALRLGEIEAHLFVAPFLLSFLLHRLSRPLTPLELRSKYDLIGVTIRAVTQDVNTIKI
jgi:hypothetical protein